MAVSLDKAVPWGRSFDEYVRMFALTPADLALRVFDCAAGPAAFAGEIHRRGFAAVACDPLYRFSAAEIAGRIAEVRPTMLQTTRENRERFVWTEFKSVEQLGETRMSAMKQFLEDFPAGISAGRYRAAELPALPFRDREFGLALCSHFLFTYSDAFSLAFHLDSVRELCRVADEARIFPLLPSFGDAPSPHLAPLLAQLTAEEYRCEIAKVPYEFQKGGNEMLCVRGALR